MYVLLGNMDGFWDIVIVDWLTADGVDGNAGLDWVAGNEMLVSFRLDFFIWIWGLAEML